MDSNSDHGPETRIHSINRKHDSIQSRRVAQWESHGRLRREQLPTNHYIVSYGESAVSFQSHSLSKLIYVQFLFVSCFVRFECLRIYVFST